MAHAASNDLRSRGSVEPLLESANRRTVVSRKHRRWTELKLLQKIPIALSFAPCLNPLASRNKSAPQKMQNEPDYDVGKNFV
jgi:hypothetical protein